MGINEIRAAIEGGRARLGVEFGSTRIKAVLIDEAGTPIAQGAHDWENQLVNNIWTYDLKDVITGLLTLFNTTFIISFINLSIRISIFTSSTNTSII